MSDDIGLSALQEIGDAAAVQAVTTLGFLGFLPQNTVPPAYVVDVVSNNPSEGIDTSALSTARVRVDAYGQPANRAQATSLAETIRTAALKANFRGNFGTDNVLWVSEITLVAGPYYERHFPRDGSDMWWPVTRADYLIWYKQTAPS